MKSIPGNFCVWVVATIMLCTTTSWPSVFTQLFGFENRPFQKLSLGVYTPNQSSNDRKTVERIVSILGIPARSSNNFNKLKEHPAIVVVGPLPEYQLSAKQLQDLFSYVENGGTLFLAGDIGKSLYPLIGADSVIARQNRFSITVETPVTDSILAYVNQPQELVWRVGDQTKYRTILWTFGVQENLCRSLARFDDNSSALVCNRYSRGIVYYLGIHWDNAVLLPQICGDFEAQRVWINGFEPTTDMFMLLLAALYEKSSYPNFRISLTPFLSKTALLLSHDIDCEKSFFNATTFAQMERNFGVSSSYFICTKYFRDSTDSGYFTPAAERAVDTLASWGFDIGSHSVSHSSDFASLANGSLFTDPRQYKPESEKTLYGELQQSAWLLNQTCGVTPVAFRSGHLAYPASLVAILEQSGYHINSSLSANDIMSNFPFFALKSQSLSATESDIIEIPITFDCSMGFLTGENKDSVVQVWDTIVRQVGENGGIAVLLIHPDTTDYKLQAEAELIKRLGSDKVWIGDINHYATFFRNRSTINPVNASLSNYTMTIELNTNHESIPPGFSLIVKGFPHIRKVLIRDKKLTQLTAQYNLTGDEWRIYSLAKDQKFYALHRKLVMVIVAAFGLIIASLSIFFIIQRFCLWIGKCRVTKHQQEKKVIEILYSDESCTSKLLKLKHLKQRQAIAPILLENVEFLKGEMVAEIALLYTALGFYGKDIRMIKSKKWWQRAEAARHLGKLRIEGSVQHLSSLLNDSKEEVRLAAAQALSYTGNEQIIHLLIKTIQKSDRWTAQRLISLLMPLREQAARACGLIAENTTVSPPVQCAALEALGNLRDYRSAALLVKLLEKQTLSDSFSKLTTEELIPFYLGEKHLHPTPQQMRFVKTILRALSKINDDSTLSSIEKLLKHPSEEIRCAACDTIATFENPQSLGPLIAAVQHATLAMTEKIITTLGCLGEKGIDCLLLLLRDKREHIVRIALHKLEERGIIEQLLTDFANGTQQQASRAKRVIATLLTIHHTDHIVDLMAKPHHRKILAKARKQ
ncbi:MAG: HEAT repeat domain-containing protein [Chitinivibrionales bacterium]|nr:HEAT repeat domain-containing protein [Chitinivibrionales bacterium]